MFQVTDPSIKLFGSDIHIQTPINSAHIADSNSPTQIQPLPQPITMNGIEKSTSAEENIPMDEACTKVVHRTNEHRTDTRDFDQEKVLKKPDKVLPCPRCNSLETKFCYFNNYNVNQPRHFCKNCQRYWTAGGTIRNVPVGAGKRKNKHSHLHYYQVAVTPDDAVHGMHTDPNPASSDMHLLPVTSRPFKEAPLSESLETMLNLKGHTKIEVDSSTVKDDCEVPSSSSVRSVESMEKECSENGIEQVGLIPLHPLHYYPVPPWAYQWNPCWNAMAFRPSSIASSYMSSATMIAIPGFSTPTVELPVSPSSYWGCMPSWAEQKDESSLVGSTFSGIPSPSSSVSNSTCSGNRSPTLGKHSRDGSTAAEDTVNQNLWVPKTVRIHDPEEAAKSSIWTTLATKSKLNKPIMKGSVFKSFEPKSNGSSHVLEDNQILRANPAAFSRSESFQESL